MTGYISERMKPFPLTELDFSGNEITRKGIADVVQFARTQGADATLVDLSRNRLDDEAASTELTRLVKNYSSFASQQFVTELLVSSNKIGRAGASKLISYAHWERDRFKNNDPPPSHLKLDLSDNCISDPDGLMQELRDKRIKCVGGAEHDGEASVHLPDFADQRDPPPTRAETGRGRGADRGRAAPLPRRPPHPPRPRRDGTCRSKRLAQQRSGPVPGELKIEFF